MVESLKELNKICQKPRYKEVGNWMVRNILRDAALPITWLLLHTPVTANQVTLISLLIGALGTVFFVCPSPESFLWGTLLLQLWYLLDHVDGQIARYRKTACLSGRFFDFIMHHVIHGLIFFALGLTVYFVTGLFIFVVWGFLTSFSITVFNLIYDAQAKTYLEVFRQAKTVQILEQPETSSENALAFFSVSVRRLYALLHKLCEIHVVINVLTGLALLEVLIFKSALLRCLAFAFYGVVVPAITVIKLIYVITAKKIDQDFETAFKYEKRK